MKKQRESAGVVAAMCEILEERRLVSGNVSVVKEGDTLIVRGDNKSNQIRIYGDSGGLNLVEGLSGTTINGTAVATFAAWPLFRLDAKMGNGDDSVALGGGPTGGSYVAFSSVSVRTDNGD